MITWSVDNLKPEGITLIVSADDIELAKALVERALADRGYPQKLKNIQMVPLPTHHRYVRILKEPVKLPENICPFTCEDVGDSYNRVVRYKVHGFWGEMISIHQSKSLLWQTWNKPNLKWSCGGRDYAAEKDDTIALLCFSMALLDSVEYLKLMKKTTPWKE